MKNIAHVFPTQHLFHICSEVHDLGPAMFSKSHEHIGNKWVAGTTGSGTGRLAMDQQPQVQDCV